MLAVVAGGNNSSLACSYIYLPCPVVLSYISSYHPNNHLHMTPSTSDAPAPTIKTKCSSCKNQSCKSLNRKTPAPTFTTKPAMATMAAVRRPSYPVLTLRTTALTWDPRHTDAVWPNSPPRQRHPSESSPLGNESPAFSAKHTPSDECPDTSRHTTFPAQPTTSDG